MELRQLRSFITLVETGFNVSQTAEKLHLVQPAVSQHLKQLEDELGVPLFRRQGKRLQDLTEAGEACLTYARQALSATNSLTDIGKEHRQEKQGVLRIGATHTQARYVLPSIIRLFSLEYPDVSLELHQGTPEQLITMVLRDAVDLAVCTEALDQHTELTTVSCYRWNRCLITPEGHSLLEKKKVTLKQLNHYPLITYVFGFTGRGNLSDAFEREGLQPNVVLGAADTDVIKTYVRENMGIGIIADMAYQPDTDKDLGRINLSHLFPWEITRIAYLKSRYLRRFQQRFIELFQAESAKLGPLEDQNTKSA